MEQQENKSMANIEKIFLGFIGAGMFFFLLTGSLLIALLHGKWQVLGGIDIFLAVSICIFIAVLWFTSSFELRKKE